MLNVTGRRLRFEVKGDVVVFDDVADLAITWMDGSPIGCFKELSVSTIIDTSEKTSGFIEKNAFFAQVLE